MANNYLSTSDLDFDSLLPKKYQEISKTHWTPESIISIAIEWLKESNSKNVLDIGSGVGKFCLIGAQRTNIHFTGIEKRKTLFNQAVKLQQKLELSQVQFIHENIIEIDFIEFDTIYYFNPFGEQISKSDWIDKKRQYSQHKFQLYQEHVLKELERSKKGTKIITYCSPNLRLPYGFRLKNLMFDGLLEMWIKY